MTYLIVFLGGGIGAALRHGVNLLSARLLGARVSLCDGIRERVRLAPDGADRRILRAARDRRTAALQLFLTTGILGGYTTFSAFSLDAVLLYERGALGLAALYVLVSVVLSIAGLFAGLALARHLF